MKKIRYAVVGLGHIAQVAVLPAFKHARKNSELVALVSGDAKKRALLAKRYGVQHAVDYADLPELLGQGAVDAVYITTPNDEHRRLMELAADYGVHVLCEKPLAVTERDCQKMIKAAEKKRVKFMTAYRLHFEAANLEAIKIASSGRLGELKLFSSVFSMQVKDQDNIRLRAPEVGGGTMYDIGIYCINAARYLFRAEPVEVFATSAHGAEARFRRADEASSVTLRFPGERLATFTTSFGAHDVADYDLVGTKGRLRLENAYEYAGKMKLTVETARGKSSKSFPKRDQFAAELVYFSDCILKDRRPETSGEEGLADVRIIRAILDSARSGQAVRLEEFTKRTRPTPQQAKSFPGITPPPVVRATAPSGKKKE